MPTPAPEDRATEMLRELVELLRASGREKLTARLNAHGMRLALTVRPNPVAAVSADLPECLANERRATRRVYLLIREMRAESGESASVWSADLVARSKRGGANEEMAVSTVDHAVARLKKLGLIVTDPKRGHRAGTAQPSLPFFGGQCTTLGEPGE